MENRSVDRIGPSIAPLLQSPMLQGAVRPIVQCSIAPGREAPLGLDKIKLIALRFGTGQRL